MKFKLLVCIVCLSLGLNVFLLMNSFSYHDDYHLGPQIESVKYQVKEYEKKFGSKLNNNDWVLLEDSLKSKVGRIIFSNEHEAIIESKNKQFIIQFVLNENQLVCNSVYSRTNRAYSCNNH